ncbi:MAG: hypothetical protein IPK16_06555 [Anaerolineales bacterium]|nr:hypothetical protein [Anaerolineales bacterium]
MTPIDTPQLLAATLIVGMIIGFVISSLWEWLYYRGRRAEQINQAVAAATAEARVTYTQNAPPPGPAPSESAYASEDYYDEQTALLDYEADAFSQDAAGAASRQPTPLATPPQTVAVQPAPANYAALAAATGAAVAAMAASGHEEEPPPIRAATKSGAKPQTSAQDLFNYELSAYREVTTPPPLVEKPPPKVQATPPVQNDPSAMAPLIAAGAAAAIARHVHDGHEPAAETADPVEPIAEPPPPAGGDPRSNPNAGIPPADETERAVSAAPVATGAEAATQAGETAVPITQSALPATASTTMDLLPGTQGGATQPGTAPATAANPTGLPATARNAPGTTLPATTESGVTAAPVVSQAQPEPAPAPDRTKARIAATAAAVAAVTKAVASDAQDPKTPPPGTPDEAPLHPGGAAAAGVAPVATAQPAAGRESAAARTVATPIAAQALANDQEPADDDETRWSDAEEAPELQLEASEPEPPEDDEALWSDADATPELPHSASEPEAPEDDEALWSDADAASEPPLAASEPEHPDDDEALWSDADAAPEPPLAANEPEHPDDDEALWSDADAAPEPPLAANEPEPAEDDEALWSDAAAAPEPVNDPTASPTAAPGGGVDSAPQDTDATPSDGQTPHAHKARKAAAAAGIAHATHAPSAGESASASPAPQAPAATAPGAPTSSAAASATPPTSTQPAPVQESGETVPHTPPMPSASRAELPPPIEAGATAQASAPQIASPATEAVQAPSANAQTSEDDTSRPGVTAAILAAGGAAIAGFRKALRHTETAPESTTATPIPNSPEAYQNGVPPLDKTEPAAEPVSHEAPTAASTLEAQEAGKDAPSDDMLPEVDAADAWQPQAPDLATAIDTAEIPEVLETMMPALAASALAAARSAEGPQGQELPPGAPEPDAPPERANVIPPGEESSATPERIDELVTSVHELITRMDQEGPTPGLESAPPENIDGTYTARNLSRTEYAVVRLMQQSRLTYGEITRLFQRKPAPAPTQADDLTRIPTLTAAHAERLQMAGVTSYQKLAVLSQQELEMLFLVPTR